VDEVKIECVVTEENLATAVSAVKAAHPYEEPAIFLSEIIDYKTLLPTLPSSIPPIPAVVEKAAHRPISVVLEGLDGVGKSTVALRLAEILNAKHMVTPPAIMLPARQWFVQQDNHMRRAYYMVRGTYHTHTCSLLRSGG
jgi:pantothenate kinase-related protein Tda10